MRSKLLLGALCTLVLTSASGPVLAATDSATSSTPFSRIGDKSEEARYHLVQLSLIEKSPDVQPYIEATKTISSCAVARAFPARFGAKLVEKRDVSETRLPPAIRAMLRDLPVGKATQAFRDRRKEEIRVLVICQRL